MKAKKQQWTAIRVGPALYKEIKAISKELDRPMSSIIRVMWKKYMKGVKKNGI